MGTKLSYKEQLLHPLWQRKRLEVLAHADFECSSCGSREKTLHAHHKRYVKGRMAWEYDLSELEALCVDCHKSEHATRELLDRLLAESDVGSTTLHVAVGLLAGYLDGDVAIHPDLAADAIFVDGDSYMLGVFASIAAGASPRKMLEAVAVLTSARGLSPTQEKAIDLWKEWSN